MTALTARQLKALKASAHNLKALINVGKGDITEGVIAAVDDALTTHELVKIKLLKSCTVDKNDAAQRLCADTDAALVQRIGRTIVLLRPRPEPDESE